MMPSNSGRPDADDDSTTLAVVDAVATHRGVSPVELPPLHEWIDTDALNSIFESTRAGSPRFGRIEFDYDGHEIAIECNEDVAITVDGSTAAVTVSTDGSESKATDKFRTGI